MCQPRRITAEVYLATASGKSVLAPNKTITVDNIDEYRPSRATVVEATNILKSMGFKVPLTGLTLTVTGSLSLFEEIFQITFDDDGDYLRPTGKPVIPSSLQHLVEGITFGLPARLFD